MGVAQVLFGNDFQQAFLHLEGDFPGASPVRFPRRNRCVSTAMVGSPKMMFKTTLAVLRPTPGSASKGFAFARNLAAMFLHQNF